MNPKNLTRDQVNAILKNAPPGVDKQGLLEGLTQRGYNLEGVDTQAAQQFIAAKNKPPQQAQQTSYGFTEPTSPKQNEDGTFSPRVTPIDVLRESLPEGLKVGKSLVQEVLKTPARIGVSIGDLITGNKGNSSVNIPLLGEAKSYQKQASDIIQGADTDSIKYAQENIDDALEAKRILRREGKDTSKIDKILADYASKDLAEVDWTGLKMKVAEAIGGVGGQAIFDIVSVGDIAQGALNALRGTKTPFLQQNVGGGESTGGRGMAAYEQRLREQNALALKQMENSKIAEIGTKTQTIDDLAKMVDDYRVPPGYTTPVATTPAPVTSAGGTEAIVGRTARTAADVVAPTIEKNLVSETLPRQKELFSVYQKAIRPTVTKSSTEALQYEKKAIDAVDSIIKNKSNLKLADEYGEIIEGQTPKTLDQFSQSINQTKAKIYKQYNALAKQSGGKGPQVDFSKTIAPELDAIISDKALQATHPEAVEYAKILKDRLTRLGSVDAEVAEKIVQNYNNSLKAFYENPSFDTASRASIDAMIANRTRSALDEVITSATGKEYQALKNEYAALKTVEADVAKRTAIDARKNAKGLIDYTDVFSGGDVVNGLLTLNPATLATGATKKGIAMYLKFLNDPNVAVEKMFSIAETGQYSPVKSALGKFNEFLGGENQPLKVNTSNTSQPIPTNTPKGGQSTSSIKNSNNPINNSIANTSNKANVLDSVKPNMQAGAVKNPFYEIAKKLKREVPKNIEIGDIGDFNDFTKFVTGEYKPNATMAAALKDDVREAAVHYGIITEKQAANMSDKQLSSKITKAGILKDVDR